MERFEHRPGQVGFAPIPALRRSPPSPESSRTGHESASGRNLTLGTPADGPLGLESGRWLKLF
jgi:hypothetical protein